MGILVKRGTVEELFRGIGNDVAGEVVDGSGPPTVGVLSTGEEWFL